MKPKPKPGKTTATEHDNKLLNYFLFGLFGALIVMLCFSQLSGDDDFFWHLATGRFIAETHIVPSSDVFGFATAGEKWIPFEWCWDVVTYLLFNAFGYTGVYVLMIVILLITFLSLGTTLKNLEVSPALSVFFLLLILIGVMYRFTIRPHLVSYLGFSVILYLATCIKYKGNSGSGIMYAFPIAFLVWANFHMGVLAGFGIIL